MQLNTKWTSNLEEIYVFYANKFLQLVGRPNIVATTTQFIGGSWIGRLSTPLAQFEGFWVLAPAPIVLEER